MIDENEEWIESVFLSMEGSQRAKPPRELFGKIQTQILEYKIVPLYQIRYAFAGAFVILVLNTFALHLFFQDTKKVDYDVKISSVDNSEVIISDYQIYD